MSCHDGGVVIQQISQAFGFLALLIPDPFSYSAWLEVPQLSGYRMLSSLCESICNILVTLWRVVGLVRVSRDARSRVTPLPAEFLSYLLLAGRLAGRPVSWPAAVVHVTRTISGRNPKLRTLTF
eukprot:gene9945-7816_t